MTGAQLERFWADARGFITSLPEEVPGAWSFGATAEHADELLELVLAGEKTGTASALWDLEAEGEPVPEVGEFSVIIDGLGRPRAVIVTTAVDIVPFAEVGAEHARSEGEGDRMLAAWREIHERFWRRLGSSDRGFSREMPVVCERFRVVFSGRGPTPTG